jgi:hypothetical protein
MLERNERTGRKRRSEREVKWYVQRNKINVEDYFKLSEATAATVCSALYGTIEKT